MIVFILLCMQNVCDIYVRARQIQWEACQGKAAPSLSIHALAQQADKGLPTATAAPPRKRTHAAVPLDTSWMTSDKVIASGSQQAPAIEAVSDKAADKVRLIVQGGVWCLVCLVVLLLLLLGWIGIKEKGFPLYDWAWLWPCLATWSDL